MRNSKIPFYKDNDLYRNLKDAVWSIYTKVDKVGATKLRHKRYLGYDLNLKNPQTLNEKMQWLKLNTYYKNPLVTQCSDKYAVRDFVKSKGLGHILTELYFAVDDVDDINISVLPEKFVLKSNSGSTGNILVTDKSKFNLEDHKPYLRKLLKDKSYGPRNVEFSYDDIENKIIAEKYIETESGRQPTDYKIFCSYGVPKFIYTATNRDGDETYYDYFTPEFEWIDVKTARDNNSGGNVKKPSNWDEMLEIASKLSEDFPLVRVDLYSEFGKTIFGELTFLSASGCDKLDPIEYDWKFGEMFDISDELKKYNK